MTSFDICNSAASIRHSHPTTEGSAALVEHQQATITTIDHNDGTIVNIQKKKNCCLSNKLRLETNDSTGFLYQHCASGPVIMSNIFLSTSLITLAEIQLGCQGDEDSCGTIYGFKPSSLIALIATVSGILSSFLLPVVGAIIDYTPNRHLVGVVSSAILVAIQAIQIYTVESTWFPMSILQAINGFIYQVVALASYAYLPEIVSSIDEKTFQWYSSLYYMAMFGHEILFLIVMAAIAVILGTDDVVTAQISQGLDTVVTGGYFILTWYYFTKKEAKAILSKDSTLCGAGFRQVFRTSTGLYHHYPKTVGRFFVGCIFAEAGE
jgi:MFS family permease